MAKFFDPRPSGKPTSSGVGKSFILKRIRVRSIQDTLDALCRFGGEFFQPNLVEMNLAAANCPIINLSNPAVSGLVKVVNTGHEYSCEPVTKAYTNVDDFFADCCPNIHSLVSYARGLAKSPAEALMELISGGRFIAIGPDGIRRNMAELADDLINRGAANNQWYVMVNAQGEPIYLFYADDFIYQENFPSGSPAFVADNWMQLCCVGRDFGSTFNGTGALRQVVIEGFTNPVIGGSVINPFTFAEKKFPEAASQSAYLSITDAAKVDRWIKNGAGPLEGLNMPLTVPLLSYLLTTNFVTAIQSAAATDLNAITFDEFKKGSQVIFTASAARTVFWALRKYRNRWLSTSGELFNNTKITESEVSVIKNYSIFNHRFDMFQEWIVDPVGDIFIETLGQIWNKVTTTETTLKNGMSSGINRAFDAATGNAVWALYVNRGDPSSDPVASGYMVGLEGGVTAYTFEGKHLKPEIFSTHRFTERDVAYMVLNSMDLDEERKLFIFVDTPQLNKNRLVHFFITRMKNLGPVSTQYIGSQDASTLLREVNTIPTQFIEAEVRPSRSEEFIDVDLVKKTADALFQKNWNGKFIL